MTLNDYVMRACSKPGGASSNDVRESVQFPQRKEIPAVRDAMVAAGTIIRVAHTFPGHARPTMHYCATREQADAWLSESGAKAPGAHIGLKYGKKPKAKKLHATAKVLVSDVVPQVAITGYDYRYTVRALPPGYVSGLDTSACSAWAIAASERA